MAQNVNSNIIQAVTGDTVVWSPTLTADWLLDGYDGADSYDDLTDQSDNYQVTHNTNDGLPDEVSFLSQAGVPQLTADLSGRPNPDGVELTPLQYFSPFQAGSPVYGIPRDIAPVAFEQGVVTDAGVESVRLFTGQMADIPVQSGRATLQAISQTRLLLSQLIQPPPVGNSGGRLATYTTPPDDVLTSTWPVSWALHRCGVYPSPPPVSGAFFHYPLHGGFFPFSQSASGDCFEPLAYSGTPDGGWSISPSRLYRRWSRDSNDALLDVAGDYAPPNDPDGLWPLRAAHPASSWVSGPYVTGANAWLNSESISIFNTAFVEGDYNSHTLFSGQAASQTPYFRRSNNTGRFECYLRGDSLNWSDMPSAAYTSETNYLMALQPDAGPADVNTHPGASGQAMVVFYAVGRDTDDTTVASIYGWVSASDRKARLEYKVGSTVTRATSTSAIPSDGLWHHVGFAWSISDARGMWVAIDGNQDSSNISNPASASLPGDTDGIVLTGFSSMIPVSEIQMASGRPARPDLMPWLPLTTWARGAHVHHSGTEIGAVIEQNAIEAYTFIQEWAQAEAATLTIDEHDVFHWRPPGWYARPTQQAAQETITTDRHAQTPDVRADYSRIRNAVRMAYSAVQAQTLADGGNNTPPALRYAGVLTIPTGTSTYRLPLDAPLLIASMSLSFLEADLDNLTLAQFQNLVSGAAIPASFTSWVTYNTRPDGLGAAILEDDTTGLSTVTARITALRAYDMEVTFTNNSGSVAYTANAQQVPNWGDMPTIYYARGVVASIADAEAIEVDADSVAVRGARVLELQASRVQTARAASQLARRVLYRAAWPVAVVDSIEVFGDPRRQPGDLVTLSDPDQSGFNDNMRLLEVQHQVDGAAYTQTLRMQEAPKTGTWGDGTSRWGRIVWAGSEPTAIG